MVLRDGRVHTGERPAAPPRPLFVEGSDNVVDAKTARFDDGILRSHGFDITKLFAVAARSCPAFKTGFSIRPREAILKHFPDFNRKVLDEIITSGVNLNLIAEPGRQARRTARAKPRFSSDAAHAALQSAAKKEFAQGWGIVMPGYGTPTFVSQALELSTSRSPQPPHILKSERDKSPTAAIYWDSTRAFLGTFSPSRAPT